MVSSLGVLISLCSLNTVLQKQWGASGHLFCFWRYNFGFKLFSLMVIWLRQKFFSVKLCKLILFNMYKNEFKRKWNFFFFMCKTKQKRIRRENDGVCFFIFLFRKCFLVWNIFFRRFLFFFFFSEAHFVKWYSFWLQQAEAHDNLAFYIRLRACMFSTGVDLISLCPFKNTRLQKMFGFWWPKFFFFFKIPCSCLEKLVKTCWK